METNKKAEQVPDSKDAQAYWNYRYKNSITPWQLKDASPRLVHYYDRLSGNGTAKRILYLLCGMSVDLEWLADSQGVEAVGVDISEVALNALMARSGHEWTESEVPEMGPTGCVFTRKDGAIKLYRGDAMRFSSSFAGHFDAIYDRYGLHSFTNDPAMTSGYVDMIRDVLKPGGAILLEALHYDAAVINDPDFKPPLTFPPPYSTSPAQVKSMFQDGFNVEHVETVPRNDFYGKQCTIPVHLITKH